MQPSRRPPVVRKTSRLIQRLLGRWPGAVAAKHSQPARQDFILETLEPRLLLSADLALAAAAGQALDITARYDSSSQRIELLDNISQTVVASQALVDFGPTNKVGETDCSF